jgi:hypothetical protein
MTNTHRRIVRQTLMALLIAASPALADKLDDFRDAVTGDGCDSLPYSDLRNTCRSQQSEVHPWCDGARGPINCTAGVRTDDIKRQLDTEQQRQNGLKDKRRDVDDKRSRASDDAEKAKWKTELESVEKEIEASKKKIEDLKADLDKRKDFVDKATYTLGKCIDYRRAVMNVFEYATDKVRGESDSDIKPYAQRLRDKYPVAISGHKEQIDNKTNALETCKKERP